MENNEKKMALQTNKWLMETNEKTPGKESFICDDCQFICYKQSEWSRHISRQKHLKQVMKPAANLTTTKYAFTCECGHGYKHMSSLCKHRKTCSAFAKKVEPANEPLQPDNLSTEMIMEFMKQSKDMQNFFMEQHKELQNTIVEISKQKSITNNIQTNNITNNNNFNLNLFLNEQCKDAINIDDFIESLQLDVEDLKNTGKLGYVLGISRIFINRLKELDVYTRPLHCTDIKRETVYIKDQNAWEKESADKSHLKQVVKKIARKNLQQLPVWQSQNPEFVNLDTPENNEFLQISLNSLGSYTPEQEEKDIDKIVRNVLKEVIVER